MDTSYLSVIYILLGLALLVTLLFSIFYSLISLIVSVFQTLYEQTNFFSNFKSNLKSERIRAYSLCAGVASTTFLMSHNLPIRNAHNSAMWDTDKIRHEEESAIERLKNTIKHIEQEKRTVHITDSVAKSHLKRHKLSKTPKNNSDSTKEYALLDNSIISSPSKVEYWHRDELRNTKILPSIGSKSSSNRVKNDEILALIESNRASESPSSIISTVEATIRFASTCIILNTVALT